MIVNIVPHLKHLKAAMACLVGVNGDIFVVWPTSQPAWLGYKQGMSKDTEL